VLTYAMPMMSAALAWPLLGERPDRRTALALACGTAGIALLAWPALQARSGEELIGPALALAAALVWALGTIATKRWPPVHDRVVGTAWQLLIGGVLAALFVPLTAQPWPARLSWPVAGALVYHTVVATAFAYVLWYRLLDFNSATVASLTSLAVPVVGVVGAMAVVGDRPGALDWPGFVLVLGGAALVLLKARSAQP
jgi:drug/metabolite transporter (DMT)-like permease